MRIQFLIIFAITAALGFIGGSNAQEDSPIGARPMGLCAFTAIADDANAITWNPAGIAQLNQQELTTMWTNLFNSGITQSYVGYVLPVTKRITFGADWAATQFDDNEISYNEHFVHLASAYTPVNGIYFGFNIKSSFSSTQLDYISEGNTRRIDGDIGILYRPFPGARVLDKIQLAFVLRDAANTSLTHRYKNNIAHEQIPGRKVQCGLAYELLNNLIISAETDLGFSDRFSFGGEYKIKKLPAGIQVAVRAGIYKYWYTGERPSYAFGGGLGVPLTEYAKAFIEYAYLDSQILPGTHRLALRIPFDFSPTAVDIIRFDYPMPLFASLYRRYSNQATVNVVLFNKQDKAIKPQITVKVDKYTPSAGIAPPGMQELTRKEQKMFSLPLILSNEILETPQGEIPVTLEITYPKELLGRFKPARKTFSISAFPKGKVPLTQKEGVRPYVAFITYEDAPVIDFARNIVERYDEPDEINRIIALDRMKYVRGHLNRFLAAIEIYEFLRAYRVYYRPDANEAYNEITKFTPGGEGYFVDSVRYPREFLLSEDRGGDCDDWSVLYASLLESCGIATALVDVPGHVFVMFNTGISPHNAAIIGLENGRYIIWNDTIWDETIWIPVDPPQQTTDLQRIDNSFYAAWESGLRQCQTYGIAKNTKQEGRIVIVREAQEKDYPPASLKVEPEKAPRDLSREQLESAELYLTDALAMFRSEWDAYMAIEEETYRYLNESGIATSHRGDFEKARQQFEKSIDQNTEFAPAYNNLGNVFFSEGDFDRAIENYQLAGQYDPNDDGIQLNLALAYLAKQNIEQANSSLRKLHQKLGTDRVCRILEIPGKKRGKGKISQEFVEKLYQILDQIESNQPLSIRLVSDDVRGMSTGLYWKR